MAKDLFIQRQMPIRQALGLTKGDKPDLAQVCSSMLRAGYAPAHFIPLYGPKGGQEGLMILGIMDPALVGEIERQAKAVNGTPIETPLTVPPAENLGTGEIVAAE